MTFGLVISRRWSVGFRRAKMNAERRSQIWHAWIDRTRAELAIIGLPPEVYLDEARWHDFLENGHLHSHEYSGFEFGQLPPVQLVALHRFLEREYGDAKWCSSLLSWVRVRCGCMAGAGKMPALNANKPRLNV
jgi:hypothetical protein